MSFSKELSKKFGGKWAYDNCCTWECDDQKRYVVRCREAEDGNSNSFPPPQYWMYGDGPPKYIAIVSRKIFFVV